MSDSPAALVVLDGIYEGPEGVADALSALALTMLADTTATYRVVVTR
jgi:hypothetical protein